MAKAVQLLDKNNNKCYPAPYWPIGSIYISVTNTNPSKWFGGTWVAFGTGRCLVGVDTSQSEFKTVMKTGGAKTHTLNTNQIPKHNHGSANISGSHYAYDYVGDRANGAFSENVVNDNGVGFSTSSINQTPWKQFIFNSNHTHSDVGKGQAHNNLQPYITVYMWRRTA